MRLARLLPVFVFSLQGFAETPLTLEAALSLALENHPQLRAGEAQIDAARAGIRTAQAYPNPEFAALVGRQTYRVPENVAGLVTSYSITQPLDIGPYRPARIDYALRGRESSEHARGVIRLSVLTAVRRAFHHVLRRKAEIKILDESFRLVEDFRKRTQVRVEVGEAGRLEGIRAEAELATARTAVNNARLQYVTALTQLRGAIGIPIDPDRVPEGEMDAFVPLPPLLDLRKEAIDQHPSLRLARSEIRRADSRVNMEQAQARPQPSLRAEIDRPPDTPTYRVGIQIPLPFWNRREGPIAEAVAQLRQTQALSDARQVELLAAVDNAYGRYQLATQNLATFQQGILREAEESVNAAETAYRLGERGILEVLDAQRVLRTVRLDYLNAQYERQFALIDLDELRAIEPGTK
ncbi:MAG TPA: TolC family protein [Bryobacteraceae bacterium]|nr:TolC family protein [Bryobacteraceae bacterium]